MNDEKIVKLLTSNNREDILIGVEILYSKDLEDVKSFMNRNGTTLGYKDLKGWLYEPLCNKFISRQHIEKSKHILLSNPDKEFMLSIGSFGVVLVNSKQCM